MNTEERAEKLLKKFFSFDRKKDKEDAIAIYQKIVFKAIQHGEYKRAADNSFKIGQLNDLIGEDADANNQYRKSAEYYALAKDNSQSITVYRLCIDRLKDQGQSLTTIAKYSNIVGTMYKKEGDLEEAIEFYKQAIQFYEAESSVSATISILENLADIYLEEASKQPDNAKEYINSAIDTYIRLIQIYETKSVSIGSEKYAMMLALCKFDLYIQNNDITALDSILDDASASSPSFETSREYTLIKKCIQAFKDQDIDRFTTVVSQHPRLSNIQVTILLRIKKSMRRIGDEDLL